MCTPSATLDYDGLAEVVVKMAKKYKKTMLASLMGLDEGIKNKEILASGGVPYYPYAERAIRALGIMLRFSHQALRLASIEKNSQLKLFLPKFLLKTLEAKAEQVY